MTARRHRLAVSSLETGGLDALVSPHFGRCPTFTVVDVVNGDVHAHEVVENPFQAHHGPGQVPAFLAELGAHAVLAGGMGGRAVSFFADHGISTSIGHRGTVGEAVATWVRSGPLDGDACAGHGHGDCEP